jgi:hypothetical protein
MNNDDASDHGILYTVAAVIYKVYSVITIAIPPLRLFAWQITVHNIRPAILYIFTGDGGRFGEEGRLTVKRAGHHIYVCKNEIICYHESPLLQFDKWNLKKLKIYARPFLDLNLI